MASARAGHIELNGKPYRLDLSAYKGRDVIDFSPRSSIPGGGVVLSTLGFYQPLGQSDWRAGFGYPWHTEASGYMRTEGEIDARHDGIVQRFTKSVKSDSDVYAKNQFLEFRGDVYARTINGVKKYNGTSWSYVSDTTAVNYLWHNGKYIFSAPDGQRLEYADSSVSDSDGWTLTGINDSSKDYHWLHHHDGFVYAGRDMSDSFEYGNQIYYDDAIDLTDLHGNPTDDPNVIYAGLEGMQVRGAITFATKQLFFRPDGIYVMTEDRQNAKRLLDYFDQSDTNNFRSWAMWNGYLIYTVKDQIIRWNGVTEQPITPPRLNDKFPYTTYGTFDHLTKIGRFLFCIGRTNEATYEEHLLCYDGLGWQKLMDLITDGTGTISAMTYDPSNNYLWFHNTGNGETHYIPFQDNSTFPKSLFSKTGTHRIYSSRLDAGFRRVIKSTPSIEFAAQNCDDSSYLRIYYSLDGDTYTPWGGDSLTCRVDTDGWTKLINPLGTSDSFSTVEYNYMNLAVEFVTSDSTQSPVLEDWVVRLLLRPDEVYGYNLPIIVASGAAHGLAKDNRSTGQIIADLKAARASKSPIKYVDPRGTIHYGYVTSINEQIVEKHADERGGSANIEERVWLNYVALA